MEQPSEPLRPMTSSHTFARVRLEIAQFWTAVLLMGSGTVATLACQQQLLPPAPDPLWGTYSHSGPASVFGAPAMLVQQLQLSPVIGYKWMLTIVGDTATSTENDSGQVEVRGDQLVLRSVPLGIHRTFLIRGDSLIPVSYDISYLLRPSVKETDLGGVIRKSIHAVVLVKQHHE
jgi:hypothetical protein